MTPTNFHLRFRWKPFWSPKGHLGGVNEQKLWFFINFVWGPREILIPWLDYSPKISGGLPYIWIQSDAPKVVKMSILYLTNCSTQQILCSLNHKNHGIYNFVSNIFVKLPLCDVRLSYFVFPILPIPNRMCVL